MVTVSNPTLIESLMFFHGSSLRLVVWSLLRIMAHKWRSSMFVMQMMKGMRSPFRIWGLDSFDPLNFIKIPLRGRQAQLKLNLQHHKQDLHHLQPLKMSLTENKIKTLTQLMRMLPMNRQTKSNVQIKTKINPPLQAMKKSMLKIKVIKTVKTETQMIKMIKRYLQDQIEISKPVA